MPATTGMKGAGYYDQHSTAQLSAIQTIQDWVDDAVANVPLPPPEQPITVLDMGSSEGRNAVRVMTTIVTGLRRRTDQPIQTIYSDLASNNFNQMPCYYRTVAELLAPLEREDSPVRDAFTVDRAAALEIPIPFLVEFRRGGDVAAYAAAYTGFLRAVSEPVVRAALNQTGRELETVESLYERIRDRLLAEPERYWWRYILVTALLTRR